ncbi:hypothetical protein GCK72_017345 [Caenorhabditis remanei]|uniref:Seven TM Receptor n=1 Tax=Caenorhabditis remanei TaxID=31234 RepID=A0A6A5G8A1_CAERE|nr:hypothetical protein GCK72_017345 [Caenorhabditis remanei]KAF1750794.1 hypothetical protein GCK72_017345 [Caenorhabditis remanei]
MSATPDHPKSFLIYVKMTQFVTQFSFFFTFFFCYILTFLTAFGVKRNYGSYKYLLTLFPIVGIFFATIELVLYPNVYSHNAGYVFYSTSRPFGMSQDTVTFCLSFYAGVYATTISMIAVQFLYRYWAIFDTELLERYNLDISKVAATTLVAYNSTGSIRWFNISSIIVLTCIMTIQYSVIIYCAVWMYVGMEDKLQMLSLSLKNLHKQFFKTLILQIVTPTITLFSPVSLILYLPLFDLECDLPTGMFLCAVTLYPAMDAIIVMYIVADYKKAAKRIARQFLEECQRLLGTVETEDVTIQTETKIHNTPAQINWT